MVVAIRTSVRITAGHRTPKQHFQQLNAGTIPAPSVPISRPRPSYKDSTAMVTRGVHRRQMLLIETEEVTQIIEYTLGYCLERHDIQLHAIVVEGNHFHRVDTDTGGIRSDFIRDLHSLLGRQLNRYYQQCHSFFSREPTSIVNNEDISDIIDRIVYSMGNPVKDGIEREGKNHKGMRKRWPQPDKVIKRPKGFWRTPEKGGKAPDEVTLRFTRPPKSDALTDEEVPGHGWNKITPGPERLKITPGPERPVRRD